MEDSRLNVLLIEDNPSDAALVQAEFEDLAGFHLTIVPNLRQGLMLLNENAADCVLLDLNLPDAEGLNGIEKTIAAAPDLPVIVLSGFGADDLLLAKEAVRLGAQEYLAKGSVSAPELERTIELAIERKRVETHRIRWARHDPKTGLPNLKLMRERFPRAVNRCQRTSSYLALMVVRVSGLEEMRSEFGIDVQEKALCEAAAILGKNIRRNDTLGMLDDASFVVLAECMRAKTDVYTIARKLLGAFATDTNIDGQTMKMWISIGIAHPGKMDVSAFDSLIDDATSAAISAQLEGGRCYKGAIDVAA